jgi:glutamine synthetase
MISPSMDSVRIFNKPTSPDGNLARLPQYYGQNVFDLAAMTKRLGQKDVETVKSIMQNGGKIDSALAARIATAVRDWALERGATHYCHWFQPQTGTTAEKHEGFMAFDQDGKPIENFRGSELLQGEPDASSFPSGGLRSTFEARGYTAWDPSSPMFLMESENKITTLYIPTIFVSHHGQTLDFKAPLLKSIERVSQETVKTLQLLGEKNITRAQVHIGAEQEYFLIERNAAAQRMDIVLTGRTVFGKKPAKGQELEDHYFGNIPPRVQAFMQEAEIELYKVGVPMKTRHNEVAPRQFEFAPIFETANIAADHNQLLMKVIRSVAARHNFMVLLHEKPFAGVNGSGKHLNWSISDSNGRNLLDPGTTPHQNIVFLTFLAACMLGIQEHADVIRASIASAGNDHRLGANEAPPAIMSVFLGEALTRCLNELQAGSTTQTSAEKTLMNLGLSHVQNLQREATDRNRTSPFAFTGNKFEFRAVGSSAPIGYPAAILNAALTSALSKINALFAAQAKNGVVSPETALSIITDIVRKTEPVRFEGNGYSQEWREEAARRGLGNAATTPEALNAFRNVEKTNFLLETGVFSEADVESRGVIQMERYVKQRLIEVNIAIEMAQTGILPAGLRYLSEVATLARDASALNIPSPATKVAQEIGNLCNRVEASLTGLKTATERLTSGDALEHDHLWSTGLEIARTLMPKLEELRAAVDALETQFPEKDWPHPQYSDILFTLE